MPRHPCTVVCPKGAISIQHGKSVIDESKCIKCGRCKDACSYNAIIKQERPCAAACGMDRDLLRCPRPGDD